jgi:hypothetical protein
VTRSPPRAKPGRQAGDVAGRSYRIDRPLPVSFPAFWAAQPIPPADPPAATISPGSGTARWAGRYAQATCYLEFFRTEKLIEPFGYPAPAPGEKRLVFPDLE